jgi:RluA family pseudouridine synthase
MNSVIKLSAPATHEFWEIPILFEDEHLLVLDKPGGLRVTPDSEDQNLPNLMALLHAGIAENKPWARDRGLTFLGNPHRLDAETSGVILLVKSKPAFETVANLFSAETPVKKYVALVQGEPAEEQFQVNAKLGPFPMRPGMFKVDPREGKQARTKFSVLEKFSRWTLMRCEPLTERPHQIRVHLQNTGLPLVGDELYGGKPLWLSKLKRDYRLKRGQEERPLLGRATLHAEELTLPHPVSGGPITFKAEWPKDLKVAVKYLRQLAA